MLHNQNFGHKNHLGLGKFATLENSITSYVLSCCLQQENNIIGQCYYIRYFKEVVY